MSDLYKEALAEAAKLREVAEQDARNSIIEQISPYIKKMIMKEASGLFLEQEEPMMPTEEPVPAPEAAAEPTPEMAPTPAPEASTVPEELPVSPAPAGTEVVNVPMQSLGDGKVVIDFKDLFADEGKVSDMINPKGIEEPAAMDVATAPAPTVTEPTPPAAEAGPTPAPEAAGEAAEEEQATPPTPITEVKNVKQLERQLAEMALKIDRLYQKNVSASTKEAYRTKLFSLLEQLDKLAANKAITPRQAELNENRLEFLFLHLKEAKIDNSYNKKKDGNKTMTTLKEFAAKLFESSEDETRLAQDSKSSGKTGLPVHRKATQHAQSVDGVQADLFEDGETFDARHAAAGSVDAEELEGLEGEEGAWEEALMEEIQSALRDGARLDGFEERPEEVPAEVKASGYFDINEAALREAVRKLRKENAKKKLQEMVSTEEEMDAEEEEEMDYEEKLATGMDEDLVLNVSLPSEVEEQLDAEDLEVDLMLSGEEEMGDEEEEVVDLDMSDEGEEEMGSEEEEMLLTDEEEEVEEMEEMAMMESRRVRRALLEARNREVKARRLAEAKRAEAATLKKDMAETNLFLSKLVYLNKFLVREDLSRKVKQQIVEHLDRANTIAEAKAIYQKINRKLDEAAAAHTAPVVGSASKPTTAGSARLDESVLRSTDGSGDMVIGTFDKWQILANIKKRED